jgi:hypothetical protein
MYKIYCLISREKEQVIYVGITKTSLGKRRSGHLKWLREEGYDTDRVGIVLIEKTNDRERERFWICYYLSQGIKLHNVSCIKERRGVKEIKNKEKIDKTGWSKIYYLNNKERIDERNKKYQIENVDKLREYRRLYWISKKEKMI